MSQMYGPGAYLAPMVVRALAGLDVEVLLPAHPDDAGALGELPPGVRLVGHAPLHLLLDGCAAVVHHGGAGCSMTALAAGVPQLALTFGSEQRAIAGRIAATGAGLHLPGHLATEDGIRAAMTDLLEKPSFTDAAQDLARSNRDRPTSAELVGTLTGLAGQ